MDEGVIWPNKDDQETQEFIINRAYPHDIFPISCVESGLRAYGVLPNTGTKSYVGIHLMDTWECLEHPRYRQSPQVIKRRFLKDLTEAPEGSIDWQIGLDSFEMWRFIELMLKGSPVIYEILYLPMIHHEEGSDELLSFCRSGLTSKIGKTARSFAIHDWKHRKHSRYQTLIAYYRLIQAIYYLREETFEWRADILIEYAKQLGSVPLGINILETYKDEYLNKRLTNTSITAAEREIDYLIGQADRAMMVTRLPDLFPEKTLSKVLEILKDARSKWI